MPTIRRPGPALRRWREKHNLSLAQLGARVFASPAMLQRIEAGRRVPGLELAMRLELETGVVVERWGYVDLRDLARKLAAAA